MSVYHPQLLPDLIIYQNTITRFANQYIFAAWSSYDRLFRYQIANDPTRSWAVLDDTLYNLYVRGATLRIQCYICHTFGHIASQCPTRPSSNFRQSYTSPGTYSTGRSADTSQRFEMPRAQPFRPPFRAPQRTSSTFTGPRPRNFCRFYNDNDQCNIPSCRFLHKCQYCLQDHPHTACPSKPHHGSQ